MALVSMKQLLEAGVHFGHQTRRWNPKMKDYIFNERNGIYIIDLQKTVRIVERAYNFIRETVANGEDPLVGTKKQAHDTVFESQRCGEFYVNERWLGGMSPTSQPSAMGCSFEGAREDGRRGCMELYQEGSCSCARRWISCSGSWVNCEMDRLPGAVFIIDLAERIHC